MKIISIHLSLWLVFSLNIFVANGQKIADLPDADIKFSLVKWSFRTQTEMLCLDAKELGVTSIEMVDPEKWEIISKHGLKVAVADGADLGIERGFCNRDWHSVLKNQYTKILPLLSKKGIPQIVCYSGINTTLTNEEALLTCVEGLSPIVQLAEQYGIIITMELISSRNGSDPYVKQTFPFYQCDNIEWGVELCKKINSPNFKLLYDIWHMNDMGRDVKKDIEIYHNYISHYQIAGIPSRNGLRKSDPFNYREVMEAIKRTGYRGHIGLEPDRVEKDIRKTIKESIEILTIKE
jgi:hydroxypyruvate isomerase